MNHSLFRACIAFLFAALFSIVACGDDSTSSPSEDDGGAPDAGPGDDADDDTGGGDGGDGGGECVDNCPTPAPSAGSSPRIITESVAFGSPSSVTYFNTTDDTIDLAGYEVCRRPFYSGGLPSFDLAPRQRVTIHFGVAGTNTATEIFVESFAVELAAEGDEIALYSDNNFASAASIEAYVVWGDAPNATGRIDVATDAGLWGDDDFVATCDDTGGIVAVGDVSLSTGWRSVTDACF